MKKFICKVDGVERGLHYSATPDQYEISGEPFAAKVAEIRPGLFSILIDGQSLEVRVGIGSVIPESGSHYRVTVEDQEFLIEVVDPRKWARADGALQVEGSRRISAPMPGKVVRLLVSEGQPVEAGQGLVVVEAMKMQNEIKSPKAGHVSNVSVSQGQTVTAGQELMVIE